MEQTEEQTESKRLKRMRQVRAILDKANDPAATPEERDTFLEKADQLMTAYVIEAWELEFAKPAGEREKPVWRTWEAPVTGAWKYRNACHHIYQYLAQLARVKIGSYGWNMKVVGYENDLDYLDMLYTSVLLDLSSHMDPKPVPGVSWEENVSNLRFAGHQWRQVHTLMSSANLPDYPYNGQPWDRKIGIKFTAVNKKVSEEKGRQRIMAANTERWVESYLEGYELGIYRQVRRLQGEQDKQGGLVLVGRDEALQEAIYEAFPELRPHPDDCECESCHTRKCRDPKCTRPACKAKSLPVKLGRARKYVDRTDYTALQAGERQGQSVSLARGGIANQKKEIG